ncbi:MAG TPA: serine hydrolase domain-containing protein [Gemmatimonadaceae bacterium]
MRSIGLAFLAALFTAGPAASQVPAGTTTTTADAIPIARDPQGVVARIDTHLSRLVPFGFSGAVLLAKDGNVLLSKGYGLADREAGIPVTAETVFDIGSITKQFTAAAILRLEMEGKLTVNDSIGRWFDSVPDDKRGITIHHLLTHTAGLEDVFGGDYEVAERDSLVRVALGSKLIASPPAPYEYSNAGYTLLAAIVEKASGIPYEQYLREKVLLPAGLTRTGYRGVDWRPGELAVGYRGAERWGSPTDHLWAPDGPYWNLRGNGGILSSLPQLFKWHQALEGDQVLSAEAKARMFAPHAAENADATSHYGYGWAVTRTNRGTPLIAHNGGNGIFFADFRRYVGEGVVFLIASTNSDASANAAQGQLLRLVFGGEYGAPPVVQSSMPVGAAPPAGTYRLPSGGTVTLAARGGRLVASAAGDDAFALLRGFESTGRLDSLSRASAQLLEAAERGDTGPLRAAAGNRADDFVRMHTEWSSGVRARVGDFRGVDVLGSQPQGPRAMTTARMRFERGERYLQIVWDGATIAGVRTIRPPRDPEFLPVSATEWAAYDFASGRTTVMRLTDTGLELDGPGGVQRAQRVN